MINTLNKTLRIYEHGHSYYKSINCTTCPVCEEDKSQKNGFLSLVSAPVRRALENAEIKTLQQLSCFSENDILKLHGIGKTSIPILIKELEKKGLTFNPDYAIGLYSNSQLL